MRRIPIVVNMCRGVTCLVIGMSLLRITLATTHGIPNVLYGRWTGPIWLEGVFAALAGLCLAKSGDKSIVGLAACAIPLIIALALAVLSPESYTAWFWLPRGGPTEPWGVPRGFTYQYRYRTHEQLVGACVAAVTREVALSAVLAWLLLSKVARRYFGLAGKSEGDKTSESKS